MKVGGQGTAAAPDATTKPAPDGCGACCTRPPTTHATPCRQGAAGRRRRGLARGWHGKPSTDKALGGDGDPIAISLSRFSRLGRVKVAAPALPVPAGTAMAPTHWPKRPSASTNASSGPHARRRSFRRAWQRWRQRSKRPYSRRVARCRRRGRCCDPLSRPSRP